MASQAIDQASASDILPDDRMKFALSVIGGTLAGAGVFGMLVGCLAGLIFGPILALVAGLPVFLATILAAWSRSLPRYYAVPAVLCGAATGFLSSSGGVLPDLRAYEFFLILATTIGGAGSGIGGIVFIHVTSAGRRICATRTAGGSAGSFGQIILHLVIVGLMGACLFRAADSFRVNRVRAEQERAERGSRPANFRD